jgi:hypothetical protein
MEKPGRDEGGNAIWDPDGERQRYAKRLIDTVGTGRLFAAAAQVMLDKGLIAEDDVGPEVVADWIQWLTLGQLRKLSRIALLIVEQKRLH